MPRFLGTIANPSHRQELFDRFRRLDPTRPPLWGRLTAAAMVAHLCDQMRMPFNENPGEPIPGPPRNPLLRPLILYVLPWPKGRIQGPPEAFVSEPGDWSEDLARLEDLVEAFLNAPEDRRCSVHPNFGQLNRRQWGVFSYRHFDHHLRQFGV